LEQSCFLFDLLYVLFFLILFFGVVLRTCQDIMPPGFTLRVSRRLRSCWFSADLKKMEAETLAVLSSLPLHQPLVSLPLHSMLVILPPPPLHLILSRSPSSTQIYLSILLPLVILLLILPQQMEEERKFNESCFSNCDLETLGLFCHTRFLTCHSLSCIMGNVVQCRDNINEEMLASSFSG